MLIYGNGKLIPPTDVLEQELAEQIERRVRADITERILREADIDAQVTEAIVAGLALLMKKAPRMSGITTGGAKWGTSIDAKRSNMRRAK
jgi:hypothetical protein